MILIPESAADRNMQAVVWGIAIINTSVHNTERTSDDGVTRRGGVHINCPCCEWHKLYVIRVTASESDAMKIKEWLQYTYSMYMIVCTGYHDSHWYEIIRVLTLF